MTSADLLREDRELSCRVLSDIIANAPADHPNLRLLLRGFTSKAAGLRAPAISRYIPQILSRLLSKEDASLVDIMTTGRSRAKRVTRKKRSFDVAIMTVILEELIATKIALNIALDKDEDRLIDGYRYWDAKIVPKEGSELSVVVTMGSERNIQCAIACEHLFASFDIGCCFLVGISAGYSKFVALGDVVASELVLDYEGARLEPGSQLRRPNPYVLFDEIYRDLMHFDPIQRGWTSEFDRAIRRLLAARTEVADLFSGRKPKFHTGVILAGEKFIADDSLAEKRVDYHERVRAVDMEGSGFAGSCKAHKIPWLVFRGISDLGAPAREKGWKLPAALAAATAAHTFISNDYRPIKN